MKISVQASALAAGLAGLNKVVEARTTIPILSNILLRAEGGVFTLRGTDLDIEVTRAVEAEVQADGSITAPARTLHDFVRKLPKEGKVTLESDDKGLVIKCGRSRCTLQTLPPEDFPAMDAGDSKWQFSLGRDDLHALFGRTQFAISTEETRYYLNGVYLHVTDGNDRKLRGVATDGHRLALVDRGMPAEANGMAGVIVPRKTIGLILQFGEAAETIDVSLSPAKIVCRFGETTLVSKLIDGTFPDYARVIPTGNSKIVTVDRADMQSAVERVATVSSERGQAVKLAFTEGKGVFSVINRDVGNASEEMELEYDGDPIEIGFNSRYLLDMLGEIGGEQVEIALADPGSPTLFRQPGSDEASFVLMPMRV